METKRNVNVLHSSIKETASNVSERPPCMFACVQLGEAELSKVLDQIRFSGLFHTLMVVTIVGHCMF